MEKSQPKSQEKDKGNAHASNSHQSHSPKETKEEHQHPKSDQHHQGTGSAKNSQQSQSKLANK